MPMPQSHKNSALIAAGTALLVSLGSVGAYVAFEKYIREPLQGEAFAPHRKPIIPPVQKAETPTFVWPETDEATNKDLNKRYADLETLKLDVAVAEQTKRLNALNVEVEALTLQRDALPKEVEVTHEWQEQVGFKTNARVDSDGYPDAYEELMAEAVAKPKLMGVFGIDGKLCASFSTPEGKRTVRKGQSLFGSKVVAITLESVLFANGTTFHVGQ